MLKGDVCCLRYVSIVSTVPCYFHGVGTVGLQSKVYDYLAQASFIGLE